jgi:alpha-ketoglutarate-dependent taurine dioxygenase
MSSPTQSPAAGNLDLRPGHPPILWVSPGPDPVGWAAYHRNDVRQIVARYGAVMIRGLGVRDHAQTAAVFGRLSAMGLLAEREAFAPRTALGNGLYSATPWPATQEMCLHNELSYLPDPPAFMLFACLTPPAGGGATPVGDASAVLQALPPALVARLEREGWLLVRNYNDEIGASWAEAFGTSDRGAVEHYCRSQGIEFSWQGDGLSTRQRRRAVVRHPVDGRPCWFNQIAFLNEWTLDPDIREYLVDSYGPDGLPFTTRFGNGEPIGEDVVNLINHAYQAHTLREAWQAGDVLVVDNIRTAHGRDPFEGDREIVVGMADAFRIDGGGPAGPPPRQ